MERGNLIVYSIVTMVFRGNLPSLGVLPSCKHQFESRRSQTPFVKYPGRVIMGALIISITWGNNALIYGLSKGLWEISPGLNARLITHPLYIHEKGCGNNQENWVHVYQ